MRGYSGLLTVSAYAVREMLGDRAPPGLTDDAIGDVCVAFVNAFANVTFDAALRQGRWLAITTVGLQYVLEGAVAVLRVGEAERRARVLEALSELLGSNSKNHIGQLGRFWCGSARPTDPRMCKDHSDADAPDNEEQEGADEPAAEPAGKKRNTCCCWWLVLRELIHAAGDAIKACLLDADGRAALLGPDVPDAAVQSHLDALHQVDMTAVLSTPMSNNLANTLATNLLNQLEAELGGTARAVARLLKLAGAVAKTDGESRCGLGS